MIQLVVMTGGGQSALLLCLAGLDETFQAIHRTVKTQLLPYSGKPRGSPLQLAAFTLLPTSSSSASALPQVQLTVEISGTAPTWDGMEHTLRVLPTIFCVPLRDEGAEKALWEPSLDCRASVSSARELPSTLAMDSRR